MMRPPQPVVVCLSVPPSWKERRRDEGARWGGRQACLLLLVLVFLLVLAATTSPARGGGSGVRGGPAAPGGLLVAPPPIVGRKKVVTSPPPSAAVVDPGSSPAPLVASSISLVSGRPTQTDAARREENIGHHTVRDDIDRQLWSAPPSPPDIDVLLPEYSNDFPLPRTCDVDGNMIETLKKNDLVPRVDDELWFPNSWCLFDDRRVDFVLLTAVFARFQYHTEEPTNEEVVEQKSFRCDRDFRPHEYNKLVMKTHHVKKFKSTRLNLRHEVCPILFKTWTWTYPKVFRLAWKLSRMFQSGDQLVKQDADANVVYLIYKKGAASSCQTADDTPVHGVPPVNTAVTVSITVSVLVVIILVVLWQVRVRLRKSNKIHQTMLSDFFHIDRRNSVLRRNVEMSQERGYQLRNVRLSSLRYVSLPLPVTMLLVFLGDVSLVSAITTMTGRQASAPPSSMCVQFVMSSPSSCIDTPYFVDESGYDCSTYVGFSCWEYCAWWSCSILGAQEIINNCPATCSACSSSHMSLELNDLSTDLPPTLQYPLPSGCLDFDGVGPALSSSPSDAIVQTACLPFPGCYRAKVSVVGQLQSQYNEESRTSFNVSFTDDNGDRTLLVSESRTFESFDFCLSDCPPSAPYDPSLGDCFPCGPGTYNDQVRRTCVSCPRDTFSSETGSSECSPCPSRFPISSKGAKSDNECVSNEMSVYAVSGMTNKIVAFNPDGENYASVVDDDGNLWFPSSVQFITPDIMIVSNTYGGNLLLYDLAGNFLDVFANVSAPTDVLVLPGNRQIAVASENDETVYIYDLESTLTIDQVFGNVSVSSNASSFYNTSFVPAANWLALGERDDEIFVSTSTGEVHRRCISRNCTRTDGILADRDAVMLIGVTSLQGTAVLRSPGFYLVAGKSVLDASGAYNEFATGIVFKCGLDQLSTINTTGCGIFTSTVTNPYGIAVSAVKSLVYISDYDHHTVRVFSYEGGSEIGRLGKHVGSMVAPASISIRPGFYAPLSAVVFPATFDFSATAGDKLTFHLVLKDANNLNITEDTVLLARRLVAFSTGSVTLPDGVITASSIQGAVVRSEVSGALFFAIGINIAGDWSVTIREEATAVPTHLYGSPFKIRVYSATTDPTHCKVVFNSSLTLGQSVGLVVFTYDIFGNPTRSNSDEFKGWVEGSESASTQTLLRFAEETESQRGDEYRFVWKTTNAGTFRLRVQDSATGVEVSNSPFSFEVHLSPQQMAELDAQNAKKFKTNLGIAIGLAAALMLVVGSWFYHRYKQAHNKIHHLGKENQVISAKAEQRRLSVLRAKDENVALTLRAHSAVGKQQVLIDALNEKIKMKQHTEGERRVMKEAMESLSASSSDELRGVLIQSEDVTISSMLGKGGFGVVHLGEYKGKKVAVKQLLTINSESVARFRFECFLMKNLRHPNIVELVGVCWDDTLLACVLEFISNGSLEDHLKKDWLRPKNEKMTWKGRILKVAQQCAAGVQYLHHSRYFDEKQDCWKDCIIHRDLKPDNILVTSEPDFTAKLTDFGEARATELNLAMTTVGTPIFMAPEILRHDHYDSKVDVYSFGICLVTMMRGEENVVKYFFEALRKHMNKKNTTGIGINILNNRMMNTNFRPILPTQLYPGLAKLISECWSNNPEERPTFDDIVSRLGGAIMIEVDRMPEPDVSADAEEGGDKKVIGKKFSGKLIDPPRVSESVGDAAEENKNVEELLTSIASLEMKLSLSVDQLAQEYFIEVAMSCVPPPSNNELEFLKRSMAHDADAHTFESIKGSEKKIPNRKDVYKTRSEQFDYLGESNRGRRGADRCRRRLGLALHLSRANGDSQTI